MDRDRPVLRYFARTVLRVFVLAGVALILALSLRPSLTVLLTGIVVACAAALAAGIWSAARIDRHLEDLGEALRRASVGDSAQSLPLDARMRLGKVAAAMDTMAEHLESRLADMQRHRDRLRAVLDTMIEAVIAVDREQRLTLVNAAACRMFGLNEQNSLGHPFWGVVRNPRMQEWVERSLAQPEPVGGELQLLVPSERVVLVHVAQLPANASGDPTGALIVVDDVTELRRLERVRQEFVANASHELKTPLASIKACVETLQGGALDEPENAIRFLSSIADQADRLDALVQDLLALARIESGGSPGERRPVGLDRVARTCIERHSQAAASREQTVTQQCEDKSVCVLCDEEALERIVENLLDNAIKYTPNGGRITVRVRTEGRDGVLEIEDTGIGIPPAHLPRIFERFYRVDRARSRALGGTGLGLSIVKHLVNSMDGNITVKSDLGKGTIFTVQIPLASRRAAV